MDIDDEHYKKYIKYKTKYLELKEYSGGGRHLFRRGRNRIRRVRVSQSSKQYETNKPLPESSKQYESNKPLPESSKQPEMNDLDYFITLYIQKEKIKWDSIIESQIPNKIFLIEDFLLNNLLNEILIYDTKTEDLVVNIYKQICNIILNYREYFYLNVDNISINTKEFSGGGWFDSLFNFFKKKPETKSTQPETKSTQPETKSTQPESKSTQPETNKAPLEIITIDKLKKSCIENIKIAEHRIEQLLQKYKSTNNQLQTIIKVYFNTVNLSIKNNMNSIVKNKIKFEKNDIYKKINNEISDDNITKKLHELKEISDLIQQKQYNLFMKKLYNIQKLLKLKVLYNSDINMNVSTDDYIMLINCFLFVFKLKLAIYKTITVKHDDLYFDNDFLLDGGNDNSDYDINIIVNKDKVINIFNTLMMIILYLTQNTDTKEHFIKDKKNYIVKYNNKDYKLAEIHIDVLNNQIMKDIISYLPNNIFIKELQKYIDLNFELQI